MYLANLTAGQLTKAREAADYLLSLPARLDAELAVKLDTFRADTGAELEDRNPTDSAAISRALRACLNDTVACDTTTSRTSRGGGQEC